MAANPMHQFQVYKIGPEIKLGNVDLSFTNASLFMLISALTICLFLHFGSEQKSIIPSRLQLIAELFYNFIASLDTQSFITANNKNILDINKKLDFTVFSIINGDCNIPFSSRRYPNLLTLSHFSAFEYITGTSINSLSGADIPPV